MFSFCNEFKELIVGVLCAVWLDGRCVCPCFMNVILLVVHNLSNSLCQCGLSGFASRSTNIEIMIHHVFIQIFVHKIPGMHTLGSWFKPGYPPFCCKLMRRQWYTSRIALQPYHGNTDAKDGNGRARTSARTVRSRVSFCFHSHQVARPGTSDERWE